jgi:DNA mismatch repair ATPase MutS
MTTPIERLRYHVTGAIERGEKVAIVEQPARPQLTPITLSNGTVVERERMDNGATRAFVRGRAAGELTNAEYVEALTILQKGTN